MSAHRLFQILHLLMNKKRVTAKELSEKLEVSIRTIYRDVDALLIAGVPVFTEQGKGGGIRLDEKYVLNKSLLSEKEQEEIVVGLASVSSIFQKEGELLDKMKALFQAKETNWLKVDFSDWGSPLNKPNFDQLKQAILNKRIIEFQYISGYGKASLRTVKPARLIFKSSAWYLQGYCLLREDYRIFKLTRIHDLIVSNQTFNEELNPPSLKLDEAQSNIAHLTLRFDSSVAYRIEEEFDSSLIVKDGDQHFIVQVDMPYDAWLQGYLLSYGGALEILSPQSIKKSIQEEIIKMGLIYRT